MKREILSEYDREMTGNGYYAYIVRCGDGTLYTGYTNDLDNRMKAHNSGRGAKYTRSRLPVELVYYEEFTAKEEAMSREWHIKRLTRAEKEKLILSRVNLE